VVKNYRKRFALYPLWATQFGFKGPAIGVKMLDIGCGPLCGMLSIFPRASGVGIDPLAALYNEVWASPYVIYNWVEAEKQLMCRGKQWADMAWCIDVLDHCKEPASVLECTARLLKPGGLLYLYVDMRPEAKRNLLHPNPMTAERLRCLLKPEWEIREEREYKLDPVKGRYPGIYLTCEKKKQ